jgi:hypothetical protein
MERQSCLPHVLSVSVAFAWLSRETVLTFDLQLHCYLCTEVMGFPTHPKSQGGILRICYTIDLEHGRSNGRHRRGKFATS